MPSRSKTENTPIKKARIRAITMSIPPSRHHVYVIKKIVVDSELTESADQKYGSLAAKEKIKSQPHSQTLFVILPTPKKSCGPGTKVAE